MFDRYNIIDERDLADAMAKRAAYEATLPRFAAASQTIRFPSEEPD